MVQHDRDGALGLVLNRPTRATVADAWQRFANGDVDSQQPVFWGGPVEGPPLVLHSQRELRQSEVLPGVYLSSRKAVIERVIRRGGRFRLFFGYAGWGAGQLEAELDMGGWLLYPATASDVFVTSERMWKRITGKIGLEILAPTIGRQVVTDQPWLN